MELGSILFKHLIQKVKLLSGDWSFSFVRKETRFKRIYVLAGGIIQQRTKWTHVKTKNFINYSNQFEKYLCNATLQI